MQMLLLEKCKQYWIGVLIEFKSLEIICHAEIFIYPIYIYLAIFLFTQLFSLSVATLAEVR